MGCLSILNKSSRNVRVDFMSVQEILGEKIEYIRVMNLYERYSTMYSNLDESSYRRQSYLTVKVRR